MKNILIAVVLLLAISSNYAQDNVGIGTITPNPKALLDLTSNDKGLLIPRMTSAERVAIAPAGSADAALLVYDSDDNLYYYWDATQWVPFPQSGSDNISLVYDSASGILTLIDDAGTLTTNINSTDRDEQILNLNTTTNVLSISNGNTVDLTPYLNTDDQDLTSATLTGTDLQIDIEDGNSVTVDLSPLLGTDDQNLDGATLTGTDLQIDIENGNSATVDLSSLVGTDDQNLTGATLTGNSLQIDIESGNSTTVDLSPLVDHDWYEAQQTTAPTSINQNIYTQGNVGIGQLNPQSILHLTGTALQLRMENTNGRTFVLNSTNAGDFRLLNLSTNTIPITVLGNNDNVGIGTTTPNYKLHINDPNGTGFGAPGIQLTNAVSGNGIGDGVRLAMQNLDFWVDNRSNGNILFATNTAERMRILNNGFVGINLTNPANILDVNGSMAIGTFASTLAPANGVIISGNTRIGLPAASTIQPPQADAPIIKLDVSGGYTRIGNFNTDPNIGGQIPGNTFAAGVGALAVGMNRLGGTSNVDFWNVTAQGQLAANNNDDRGFDWRRYDQFGNEQLLMTLNGAGNLTISGTNYLTSDKRLKSGIEEMSGEVLNKVMGLQPSIYNKTNASLQDGDHVFYAENENTIKDFGFIAQEVYKIFPELVYKPEDESKELWAVDYARLSVMLTKAIQEQQKTIQSLERENHTLKAKLESTDKSIYKLESDIELLKNYLYQSGTR